MKISTKLLLIISLATALIGLTALSGVLASSRLLENEIKDKFMGVSAYAMEKVHRLFAQRYQDLAALASEPVIVSRRSSTRQITEKLNEYRRHFGSYVPYSALSFFDLRGKRIAGTEGKGIRSSGNFPASMDVAGRTGTILLQPNLRDPQNGGVFHLAHVVDDPDGVPFGMVVADIPSASLHEIVKRPLGLFKIDRAFDVDLIDAKGLVLFSTRANEGVFKDISPLFGIVAKSKAMPGSAGTILHRGAGGREIVVFAREARDASFPGNDWTFVISLPERTALAPLMVLKDRLVLVFGIIAGIAIGLVLLLSRTITGPLARLHRAIAEVGKGNLDVSVDVATHDEIGRLSRLFNGMVGELRQLHGQLWDAASLDGLTGAFNRKRIDEFLCREVDRARKYRIPLSLILLDLDHFKGINDTHGHLRGDDILRTVIAIIKENIRRTDLLGRWGGEEFMLLAPGVALDEAARLAEKIRQRVEGHSFASVGAVTISCGVAAFLGDDDCTGLVKRADDALYHAKGKGRNLVEVGR